jgi:hypothetical protein
LRDENAELYSSSFIPSTENHKSIETLLTHGETAYQHWSTEVAKHKLSASPSERGIWQQYLDAKKKLEPSNA